MATTFDEHGGGFDTKIHVEARQNRRGDVCLLEVWYPLSYRYLKCLVAALLATCACDGAAFRSACEQLSPRSLDAHVLLC